LDLLVGAPQNLGQLLHAEEQGEPDQRERSELSCVVRAACDCSDVWAAAKSVKRSWWADHLSVGKGERDGAHDDGPGFASRDRA
jgi:hypothetical protein